MSWVARIILAAAAAFLFARSQPPRMNGMEACLGLTTLLISLRGLSPRFAFWLGTGAGSLLSGLSIPWMLKIFPGATPYAIFVLCGLFFGLFAAVNARISPRIGSVWLRIFWIAAWWVAVEFYRSEWFILRFSWITPGVAGGPTYLTPFIGVYGQSFLIVFAAALMTEYFFRKESPARKTFSRFGSLAIVLAVILSLAALDSFRPPPVEPRDPVRVAAVQFEDGDFDAQMTLTRAATNSPQLVIWPETAVFGDVRREYRRQFAKLREHAKASNVIVTVGCRTTFGTGERDWFNTALTFDGSGDLGEHHKNRPVHLFNDGIRGATAAAVKTPLGKIGTPICFDCDYTEICRRMARDGAEIFAVPSRDPSPWGDLQRVQHAQLLRLRAAECGRWFAIASAAGITQIIDPNGNVRASLPPYRPAVLCGTIGRERARTFYIACGWLLPWILSAIAVIGGIAAAFFPMIGNSRPAKFQ